MQYVVNLPHAVMLFLAALVCGIVFANWFDNCSEENGRVEYELVSWSMILSLVIMFYCVVCAFIDIWVMF